MATELKATELKMTLLLRRAEFVDSCVLNAGEPGYHTSTHEFKVGDGSTTWKELPIANETQIQAMIDASIDAHKAGYYTKDEIDELLKALQEAIEKVASDLSAEVTARENADTALGGRIDGVVGDLAAHATACAAEDERLAGLISGEVSAREGEVERLEGLITAEAEARTAADNAINTKIGTVTEGKDVVTMISDAEAAAKAHAETKANAAQSAAEATAESKDVARAQAAATALSEAKTDLEGKISSGDATTLQSAKDYTDEKVAAEAKLRSDADDALDSRLGDVEAKLNNVSNVMDFVGAAAELPVEGTNHNGDVIVITDGDNAGKEFVYDDSREAGKKWVEFGSTSATDSAVADLKSRMSAAEGDIDQAQADILALGTNKLDAQTFTDHENGHAKKQTEITADIATARQGAYNDAVAEADRLDGVLKAELQGEIDSDVAAAIAAEVTRSDAKAKELADAAQAAAEATAEAKDAARYTTITSDIATAKQEAINAAKEYTDGREVEIKKYADQAEADAVTAANDYTDEREIEIKKYADQAEANAVATAKDYTDTQDAATLTAAKAYADEKVAGAVTKVSAGTDIVVTPEAGTGNVTVAHGDYSTGTFTKTPDPLTKPNDTYFFKSITVNNGHVTGGEMQILAEALSSMIFVIDGGTEADTVMLSIL